MSGLRTLRAQAPLREAPERAVCPACDGIGCVKDAETGVYLPCRYCSELGEVGVDSEEDERDGEANE